MAAAFAAFHKQYNADQKWERTPRDAPEELRLLESRKNDMFPQGRDNCIKFLRECQRKGYYFRVKVLKTSPYWTWYYEFNRSATAGSAARSSEEDFYAPFYKHYDADEAWDCSPGDVSREMRLLEDRRNDMFPQGRDNCLQFLKACHTFGYSFKVKAVKTSPYWTWYYEFKTQSREPTIAANLLAAGLGGFCKYHDADQTWECDPSSVSKELRLLEDRRNDMYPQGRDNCFKFLRLCQSKGYSFKVKAVKTSPYWTWYYEVITKAGGERFIAMYAFNGEQPGDLQFRKGDVITVTDKNGAWWFGSCNGRTGPFPSNYVRIM